MRFASPAMMATVSLAVVLSLVFADEGTNVSPTEDSSSATLTVVRGRMHGGAIRAHDNKESESHQLKGTRKTMMDELASLNKDDKFWGRFLQGEVSIPTAVPTRKPRPTPSPVTPPTPSPVTPPTPAPVTDPVPSPTPAPVTDPTPPPTPAPVTDPVTSPTPAPVTDPVPQPTPAPVTDPIPQPTPVPVTDPTPPPTSAPVTDPTPPPTPAPVTDPTPSPVQGNDTASCAIVMEPITCTTVDDDQECNQILAGSPGCEETEVEFAYVIRNPGTFDLLLTMFGRTRDGDFLDFLPSVPADPPVLNPPPGFNQLTLNEPVTFNTCSEQTIITTGIVMAVPNEDQDATPCEDQETYTLSITTDPPAPTPVPPTTPVTSPTQSTSAPTPQPNTAEPTPEPTFSDIPCRVAPNINCTAPGGVDCNDYEAGDDDGDFITIQYFYQPENVGSGPVTLTELTTVRHGVFEDLFSEVTDPELMPGESITIVRSEVIDISSRELYEATLSTEASFVFNGAIGTCSSEGTEQSIIGRGE